MYTGSLGTVSNDETWEQSVDVVDDTGADVTITGATIKLGVRAKGDDSTSLTASTDDGSITIVTPRFTWTFAPSSMNSLDAGTYDVGLTIEISGTTTQLIIGTVAVVDGIVSS